jgi:hypothetical protein
VILEEGNGLQAIGRQLCDGMRVAGRLNENREIVGKDRCGRRVETGLNRTIATEGDDPCSHVTESVRGYIRTRDNAAVVPLNMQ